MPMTPFMGVRISWLMLARNSLLAAFAMAASAAIWLARTVASASWRLVSRSAFLEASAICLAASASSAMLNAFRKPF
jgi:hypothetical protein